MLRDDCQTVPFCLSGDGEKVFVEQPLSSDQLKDNINMTHDEFTGRSGPELIVLIKTKAYYKK